MKRKCPTFLVLAILSLDSVPATGQQSEAGIVITKSSSLDPVIKQVIDGDDSAFHILSVADRNKVIRLLKDRVYPQYNPGDPRGLAIGAILARLHAERYLHEFIVELARQGGPAADRERSITFDALSFMRSRGAVRAVVPFLNDTALREQIELLEAMDEGKRKEFLKEKPDLQQRIASNVGDNSSSALVALCKMGIPGAPKMDYLSFRGDVDDLNAWREWWKANEENFHGDGPLPGEPGTEEKGK